MKGYQLTRNSGQLSRASRLTAPRPASKPLRFRRWMSAVLLLASFWYLGGSCSLLQALFDPNGPQFRIAGFSIEDISLDGMTVSSRWEVTASPSIPMTDTAI